MLACIDTDMNKFKANTCKNICTQTHSHKYGEMFIHTLNFNVLKHIFKCILLITHIEFQTYIHTYKKTEYYA